MDIYKWEVFHLKKTKSTFDPKLLQIDSVTEISLINDDEKKKKSSNSTLNITNEQCEQMEKNDPRLFTYFLCSKFCALEELNLNDELDDGNPIEIKKVEINKKTLSKKNNHVKFSKSKNSNENLNEVKIHKHPKRKQFSCVNVKKRELYKIDDLKIKSKSDKNNEFILHEGNCKSPNLKLRRHKKKSKKNKDIRKSLSISIIKSNNFDYDNNMDGEKNIKDSLEPLRIILQEMEI